MFKALVASIVVAAAVPAMAATIFSQSDFTSAFPNSDGFTFGTPTGNLGSPATYGTIRSNGYPGISATGGNPDSYIIEGGGGTATVWVALPRSSFATTQDVTFQFDYQYGLSAGGSASSFMAYGLKNDLANVDDAKVSHTWETPVFAGSYTELFNVAVPTSNTWTTLSQTVAVDGNAYDAVWFRISLSANWPNVVTGVGVDNISVSPVPEPIALSLAGLGLLGLARRRQA